MNDNQSENTNQKEKERRETGLRAEGEVQVRSEVRDSLAGREERRARRRRCDYGSVKASERDLELLGLIGEQYAVTVPQLARLIGRRLDTARSLRDRWKRAGWINSGQLSTQAPSFVWLTSRGAANSPFRLWQPTHARPSRPSRTSASCSSASFASARSASAKSLISSQNHDRGNRGHLDAVLTGTVTDRDRVELTLKAAERSIWRWAETTTASGTSRNRLVPTLQKVAAELWRNVYVCSYPPSDDALTPLAASGSSAEPSTSSRSKSKVNAWRVRQKSGKVRLG
jgi:hypothetical protein